MSLLDCDFCTIVTDSRQMRMHCLACAGSNNLWGIPHPPRFACWGGRNSCCACKPWHDGVSEWGSGDIIKMYWDCSPAVYLASETWHTHLWSVWCGLCFIVILMSFVRLTYQQSSWLNLWQDIVTHSSDVKFSRCAWYIYLQQSEHELLKLSFLSGESQETCPGQRSNVCV